MPHPLGYHPTKRYANVPLYPYWYIACRSEELRNKPKQIKLWNTHIVLFRDHQNCAYAMLDRCPHRNVPLSIGKIKKDVLELSLIHI